MPNSLGQISPLLSDFTYGELSPVMLGRSETVVYHKGGQVVKNMIPKIQGGFSRRPGTRPIGNTYGDLSGELTELVISSSLWYLLEFTDLRLRIWGNMETTPSVVQTVTTSYVLADLPSLRMAWAYPYLFIVHPTYPPVMLKYSSLDTFLFVNPIPIVGSAPNYFTGTLTSGNKTIASVTPDPTLNGLLAAVFGGTMTNGSAVITSLSFDPTLHPFSLIGMPIVGTGIGASVTVTAVTSTTVTMSASYSGTTGAYTGITVSHAGIPVSGFLAPISTTPAGIAPNSKVASVTTNSIIMDTNANASGVVTSGIAISQDAALPFQSAGNYPAVVACANQRVIFASSTNNPQKVWVSNIGIFDDYGMMFMQFFEQVIYYVQTMSKNSSGQPLDSSGNVVTAAAGNTPLYNNIPQYQLVVGDADGYEGEVYSDRNDSIQWAVGSVDVILGTLSGQILIEGNATANDFAFRSISRTGCANIRAYFISGGILFVDRSKKRVMLLNWQGVSIDLTPPDTLSLFSEHLFSGSGIKKIAVSWSPSVRLWFLQDDGTIVGCEYDDRYDARAWWDFVTDGTVISIAVGQSSSEDVLYMIVSRNSKMIIEKLATQAWVSQSGVGGLLPAICSDSAIWKYNATPFTVVTGLANLEGKTVQMIGDGMYLGTAVVASSQVTLPNGGAYPASYNTAVVGLSFDAILTSMPIELGDQLDSTQAQNLTIPSVGITFYKTLYAEILGVQGGTPEVAVLGGAQTTFPILFSGLERVPVPSGFATGSCVTVQSSKPFPLTVSAMVPEVIGYE